MLYIVDKVLVMSVNPGNAGQMFMPFVRQKYAKLLSIKDEFGVEIYWDGACSADKIQEYAPLGVKGFILGTTLLFGKNRPYADILKDIHELKF
jgi:ribulose-phosphate 3-epimerase